MCVFASALRFSDCSSKSANYCHPTHGLATNVLGEGEHLIGYMVRCERRITARTHTPIAVFVGSEPRRVVHLYERRIFGARVVQKKRPWQRSRPRHLSTRQCTSIVSILRLEYIGQCRFSFLNDVKPRVYVPMGKLKKLGRLTSKDNYLRPFSALPFSRALKQTQPFFPPAICIKQTFQAFNTTNMSSTIRNECATAFFCRSILFLDGAHFHTEQTGRLPNNEYLKQTI